MTRVIGIGSPFGDDRVGWRVIELLRGRLAGDVELIALDRPGAALIHWMQGSARLILIDAVAPRGRPGSLTRIDPDRVIPAVGVPTSHALDLCETLRLAEALAMRPGRLDIYGIEIAGLAGAEPCDAVERGAQALANRLCAELQQTGAGAA